jgi:NADH:ubiquinone oxidoreductase subunit H
MYYLKKLKKMILIVVLTTVICTLLFFVNRKLLMMLCNDDQPEWVKLTRRFVSLILSLVDYYKKIYIRKVLIPRIKNTTDDTESITPECVVVYPEIRYNTYIPNESTWDVTRINIRGPTKITEALVSLPLFFV